MKLENQIIKLFMDNSLTIQEQLDVLEITQEKVMWCRKIAKEFIK